MLKPRIDIANLARVPQLETKAGATVRIRGRIWGRTRERIAKRDGYRCKQCECLWDSQADQVDHVTPLEQGGSNDDDNLQLLCDACHKLKTAKECAARW